MIILASGSPRRKELLEKFNLKYEVFVSNFNEETIIEPSPSERVKKLAFSKANSVYNELGKDKDNLILAADTIVYCNNKFFNKPKNREDAFNMLQSLSNNTHSVYTGICIIYQNKLFIDYAQTNITFRKLTNSEINNYLNTDEPYDKAGAYAIQGLAKNFVLFIDGSYDNVVGLPTELVNDYFIKLGIINEKIK